MKALVYNGPGLKAIEERPKPAIQAPGDAIVKIVKPPFVALICTS